MVRDVLAGADLADVPADSVQVSLGGFAVLPTSSTGVLRDGDLLQLERRAPRRKRAREEGEDEGRAQEKRAKAEVVPQSEKGPSRSARRKAAKRRFRRQGNAATGIKSHPLPELLKTSAKNKPPPPSSSSDKSSSSSESTSTSDDDSSSTSSSSSDEEEAEQQHDQNSPPPAAVTLTEDQFAVLQPCGAGAAPAVGRVVAYKLLEIGEDFAPRVSVVVQRILLLRTQSYGCPSPCTQISEPRAGKVTGVDGDQLTLEPYPDPAVHPLQHIRDQYSLEEGEEEEEEGEEPPSAYDESGELTAELASFAEMRYFDGGGAPLEPLGPTTYARQGPPVVPKAAAATTTALASLMEQLQRRRAELAAEEQQAVPQNPQPQRDAAPAAGRGRRLPRRGGVFHTALGPMLNMLRGSDNLEK